MGLELAGGEPRVAGEVRSALQEVAGEAVSGGFLSPLLFSSRTLLSHLLFSSHGRTCHGGGTAARWPNGRQARLAGAATAGRTGGWQRRWAGARFDWADLASPSPAPLFFPRTRRRLEVTLRCAWPGFSGRKLAWPPGTSGGLSSLSLGLTHFRLQCQNRAPNFLLKLLFSVSIHFTLIHLFLYNIIYINIL